MSNPVLLLTGPPGAGKTTVAAMLANAKERSVHIESDLFFRFVRAGRIDPWKPESHDQNVAVMQAVAAASVRYAAAGYFTIVDGIISPPWFLTSLREAITVAGHSAGYVVLRASLATCASRAAARAGTHLTDAAVIGQLYGDFSDLGELEDHVIDTDRRTPEAAAHLILDRLRAGELLL